MAAHSVTEQTEDETLCFFFFFWRFNDTVYNVCVYVHACVCAAWSCVLIAGHLQLNTCSVSICPSHQDVKQQECASFSSVVSSSCSL